MICFRTRETNQKKTQFCINLYVKSYSDQELKETYNMKKLTLEQEEILYFVKDATLSKEKEKIVFVFFILSLSLKRKIIKKKFENKFSFYIPLLRRK